MSLDKKKNFPFKKYSLIDLQCKLKFFSESRNKFHIGCIVTTVDKLLIFLALPGIFKICPKVFLNFDICLRIMLNLVIKLEDILTSNSCSVIVIAIIKYIAYNAKQIPFSYEAFTRTVSLHSQRLNVIQNIVVLILILYRAYFEYSWVFTCCFRNTRKLLIVRCVVNQLKRKKLCPTYKRSLVFLKILSLHSR